VKWEEDGSVEFRFRADRLTSVPYLIDVATKDAATDVRHTTVNRLDGSAARLIESPKPTEALRFLGTNHTQYEQLRTLIMNKNELYFYRWRPQNITYLYGFRKHEQGNNAAEIAMFDPLIDELEKQIQAVQRPEWQTLRVSR
jgi:hypothetical protein